jgi:dTDP-4-dehydrorhamnose reductase
MRVLVLGGGQIAKAVAAAAPPQHEIAIRTHAELDILDETALTSELSRFKADWIVNGAAYTAVDLAEDEPAKAISVNDTAVASLVRAALAARSRLLHLSTDFVFDGESNRAYLPSDSAKPLNIYGASKLGGEHHVIDGGTGIVLRTSWVYGAEGKNFVLTMLRLMRERDQISVVCDQIGAPTWATSVAGATWGLIDAEAAPGIYHWADLGVASWYDLAVAIQDEALSRRLICRAISVLPIYSSEYPAKAQRPAFSVLDSAFTRSLLKLPGAHWRHNLRMMLDELRAA